MSSSRVPTTGGQLHRTLARQLRRLGLEQGTSPDPQAWDELLEAVSAAYGEADDERYTLERSIDISSREMRSLHEVLSRQALQDALTGLPNRVALLAHLESRFADRSPTRAVVAALFIDLDGFKQVNDSLGHAAGDELLVRTAERIRACLRPGDIVARLGGDEFVVICDGADDPTVIAAIAERIGAQLAVPFRVATQDAVVSASIGLAASGDGCDSAEALLHRADLAMYDAKIAGKARTSVFDVSMQSDVDAKHSIGTSLSEAVRRGELRLVFQPLVSLTDNRTVAVEALVRWERPGVGTLTPDGFVPIAGESSLITEVDRWVITEAIRRCARWCQAGGTVAINVSARTLEGDAVVDALSTALVRYGVPAHAVALEITEPSLMGTNAAVDHTLVRLREIGVGLSIDDFGTGSWSLSQLRGTAADVVKIDQSLISIMDTDEATGAIVGAIITMAHALGLIVVAEGVERQTQADGLRAAGCDQAQGWLFATPLAAEQLDQLLDETFPRQGVEAVPNRDRYVADDVGMLLPMSRLNWP